jgi:16S rRNA G966 N2-methylase RsmD
MKYLNYPLIQPGELVSDLDTHKVAKWLIDFWCNDPGKQPLNKLTPRSAQVVEHFNNTGSWYTPNRRQDGVNCSYASSVWGKPIKSRLSSIVDKISSWTVLEGNYYEHPNEYATWFIDPPYNSKAGKSYRYSDIDYDHLADWSLSRKGQIIVCEDECAEWLPFEYLTSYRGQSRSSRSEMIYTENSPNWSPPLQPFNPSQHNIIDWLRVE